MKLPQIVFPLFATLTMNAAIVSYDFDSDTAGSGNVPAGWSVSNSARVYVSAAYSESSPNSLYMQNDSTRTAQMIDFAAIPDVSKDLVVSFDYYSPATLEEGDSLGLQIDFGAGYQDVLTDAGMPNGFDQTTPYTGSTIVLDNAPGMASSFENYSIVIPSTYYNDTLSATSLKLRFSFSSGAGGENAFIDNVSVNAVPEPSSFGSILALSAIGFVVLRRKRSS